jgi:hypothetical protein
MQSTRSIRTVTAIARCAALSGVALLCIQLSAQSASQSVSKARSKRSALPATAPTTPAPAPVEPPQYPVYTPPPTPPASRAQVTYSAGMLSVTANNSSLNQILREISRLTGMKITGGVNDERVFATYGPAPPATVVTALLDGTGSNFLLVNSVANPDGGTAPPVELVLTPRHGGPTPPNPNAASSNDTADFENLAPPTPANYAAPPVAAPSAPPAGVPAQNNAPAPVSPPDGSTPAAPSTPSDAATPDNPNGVKSPQQIYEQLLRLRQQQQQTSPN